MCGWGRDEKAHSKKYTLDRPSSCPSSAASVASSLGGTPSPNTHPSSKKVRSALKKRRGGPALELAAAREGCCCWLFHSLPPISEKGKRFWLLAVVWCDDKANGALASRDRQNTYPGTTTGRVPSCCVGNSRARREEKKRGGERTTRAVISAASKTIALNQKTREKKKQERRAFRGGKKKKGKEATTTS